MFGSCFRILAVILVSDLNVYFFYSVILLSNNFDHLQKWLFSMTLKVTHFLAVSYEHAVNSVLLVIVALAQMLGTLFVKLKVLVETFCIKPDQYVHSSVKYWM